VIPVESIWFIRRDGSGHGQEISRQKCYHSKWWPQEVFPRTGTVKAWGCASGRGCSDMRSLLGYVYFVNADWTQTESSSQLIEQHAKWWLNLDGCGDPCTIIINMDSFGRLTECVRRAHRAFTKESGGKDRPSRHIGIRSCSYSQTQSFGTNLYDFIWKRTIFDAVALGYNHAVTHWYGLDGTGPRSNKRGREPPKITSIAHR
jgi:hypothetical protein